ncbi:MotA/TolQ/ExbB proton channel family protein [Planctomycetaceae bacterium SH139]
MSNRERGLANQGSWVANTIRRFSGLALAAGFYALVMTLPVPMLERYFLGHPVAIAATVLFCVAVGQLWARHREIAKVHRQLGLISDRELVPQSLHAFCGWPAGEDSSGQSAPAGNSIHSISDRVNQWLAHLREVPPAIARSAMVLRLTDLLERQQRRGHADQLSDDMREVGDRQADADHDALQFVRIIVWAIPMLGFLGTVIGITQTLGGLDFTDGAAAVERLKSGLYVAFDTTALGLVLSVIAIFLQFPVEKHGREVLQEIEQRSDRLLPAILSSGTKIESHDPLVALRQMTLEISQTVKDSVRLQAELWRQAIDSAHDHWQRSAHESADQLKVAMREVLGDSFAKSLQQHANSLRQTQREGAEQIDNRWQQWQTALSDNARVLLAHQKTLLQQGELLADSHARAAELQSLQSSLDTNVKLVTDSVEAVDRGLQSVSEANTVSQAMLTLAEAVEVLATRLPATQPANGSETSTQVARRALTRAGRNAA